MRNDGGPAFPKVRAIMGEPSHEGLSMRDYFAAAALQTLTPKWSLDTTTIPNGLAFYAYQIADAMLAERAKP